MPNSRKIAATNADATSISMMRLLKSLWSLTPLTHLGDRPRDPNNACSYSATRSSMLI